jgi:transposase
MTNSIKRYSESFRRQVITEYEAGCTISDLQKKYGIMGGSTIQKWIKKYSNEGLRTSLVRIQTAEEANQVTQLNQQINVLERALVKMTLEKLKYEAIVEELEQLHGKDDRKKTQRHHPTISAKSPSSRTGSNHGHHLC